MKADIPHIGWGKYDMMESLIAEKVLFSRNIFTSEAYGLIDGGVAICGNKIVAVGGRKEIENYISGETSVFDFGERFLMPGFCDSHVHLIMGALATVCADLSKGKSAEECCKILRKNYDRDTGFYSPGEWVLGFNWYQTWWDVKEYPDRKVLDRYFPDVPVFLMNADCHGGWVNSKALEICGVDNDTPDVRFGTIHRDAQGNPTGYLEEMAVSLCIKKAYDLTEFKESYLLQKINRYFSTFGITSIGDMQYILGTNVGSADLYKRVADNGELDFRINFANGLFDPEENIRSLRKKFHDKEDYVYYNGLKEFVDGIISTHTAIMLDKYSDDPNAPLCYQLINLEEAKNLISRYHKLGFNVHLHATGDGAVRRALDMYANAIRTNGKTASRLSVEHLDLSDPADHKRLGELGIVTSVQPPHITLSDSLETNDYLPVLGEKRSRRLWSFKSFADNGAVLAFGTDYPVVGANPMIGLHRAVTRKFPDGRPVGGWNPEQKLSIEDALKAYTLGGAMKFGKEDVLGTISPGKLADLVVIDRNLLAVDPDEILDSKAIFTMVNGRVVYVG